MVEVNIDNYELEPDVIEVAHIINKSPYIGANGNWYVFDSISKGYVDTGVKAEGKDGTNGKDGVDGITPTATVTKSDHVAKIEITDANGTTTAEVTDGTNYEITESDYEAIAEKVKPYDDAEIRSELAEKVGFEDYATSTRGGVIKPYAPYGLTVANGIPYLSAFNYSQYQNASQVAFVGKGTLENVLAERLKEPKLEKILDVTLTEDVQQVNFDASGKKYVAVYVKATQSFLIYLRANGVIPINVPTATPSMQIIFSALNLASSQSAYRGKAYIEGGMLFGEYSVQADEPYLSSPSVNRITRNFAIDGGTFGTMNFWSNTVIPSGTHLEVWGA